MAIEQADVERLLEIAGELRAAGRDRDAALLARLASETSTDVQPAVSEVELDRRLDAADADIAAGRLTADEDVWGSILARRRARSSDVAAPHH